MKKEWVLTQEAFDRLLDWLDPDRDQAGRKYEAIRLRLIKIFTCRGCFESERLADETINRVTARVEGVAPDYVGDPALYFYAVAHKVHLEYLRKEVGRQSSASTDSAEARAKTDLTESFEAEYQCLEGCLDDLPGESRDLVLRYYELEGQAKIDHRKQLAAELGIAVNALRIRAHRIRRGLQRCMRRCLEKMQGN
jgi:DNA-directed RNA polymerase specialized sigma24 family protein